MSALWNQRIFQVRVTLLKMAIDNEISRRSERTVSGEAIRGAVGESLRAALILIEDACADLPGYTSDSPREIK
jgi:hypothetical protein